MKFLPSWIRLARFNWSSFTVICFVHYHLDTYRSNLTSGLDRLFKGDARVVPGSRPRLGLIFARVCVCRQIVASTFAPYWSGIGQVARPASSKAAACAGIASRWRESSACQRPSDLPALCVACRYSPVGFDRQQPSILNSFWAYSEIGDFQVSHMKLMEEKEYKMVEGSTILSTIKKHSEYRVLTR